MSTHISSLAQFGAVKLIFFGPAFAVSCNVIFHEIETLYEIETLLRGAPYKTATYMFYEIGPMTRSGLVIASDEFTTLNRAIKLGPGVSR